MTKERGKGIFRSLADLMFRNWGLKLLALALAILIYHTLKPASGPSANGHDRRFHVSRQSDEIRS